MYYYFTCEWIINTCFWFGKLIRIAEQLQCDLVAIGNVIENEDGYFIYSLAVRVTSVDLIEDFIEKTRSEMGITEWRTVSEEYYKQGDRLARKLEDTDSFSQSSWFSEMLAYGRLNEVRQDRHDNETPEAIYSACDWLLLPQRLLQLEKARREILNLEGIIYLLNFRKDQQGHYFQTIGIRAPSSSALQVFMHQIGNNIGLENCHQINPQEFYIGARINERGVYSAEALAEANLKYALENEELHKKANR